MAEIRSGLLTGVTDRDFKDALAGVPANVAERVKTRIAQSADVSHLNQQYYNPFWEISTMEIPKDRRKLNAWCRYFFDSEPLVHAAITLHTEFPLSAVAIEHPDPEIKDFLEECMDRVDLFEFLMNASLEYWTVGEFFAHGIFDDPDDPQMWEKFILLDPDFTDVYTVPYAYGDHSTKIQLLPDPKLVRIVENGPYDPNTGDIYNHLPSDLVQYCKANVPMPLDPLCASHVKGLSNPHNERGTPLLLACCLPGTPIWLPDGRVVPVEDVQAGACLTSTDGTAYPALDVGVRNVAEDIGVIKYQGINKPLRLTLEDKLLVTTQAQTRCSRRKTQNALCIPGIKYPLNGNTHNCDNDITPSMVGVRDIKCGDYVVTPYPQRTGVTVNWTKEQARLLGYYVSEGSAYHYVMQEKYNIGVTSWTTSEQEIIDDISGLVRTVFNKPVGVSKQRTNPKTSVSVYGVKLSGVDEASWFIKHGHQHAKTKYLSEEVMNLSDDLLLEFLASFINGDGTVTNGHVKMITSSEQLAWQLYTICLRLYMTPAIEKRVTQPNGFSDVENDIYWIKLNRRDSRRIPMMARKYDKIKPEANDGRRTAHNQFWHDGYLYHKVISADKEFYEGTVHPIHTDVTHTYVANGVVKANCMKLLMYRDKLRSAQYAIADRHVTPKEFYMIGETGNEADTQELAAFKEILMSTWTQPNQAIIYHHALRIEWLGAAGKILPLQAEFDDIEKHVLAGLMTSRAFLQGEGPSYASSSIALDVLIQRYLFYRKKLEKWLLKSFFGPILKIHGMYKPEQSELNNRYRVKGRERRLWEPEIVWEKQNMRDDLQRSQLIQALYDKGLVPASHVLKYHNIDPENAAKGIEKEKGSVFDKNAQNPAVGDMGGMGDLGGLPMGPGDLPPLPEGGMPMPSEGGMELPPGGFGGEDMGNLPIGPGVGGGATAPESMPPVSLPR